jgi:MFS family permease
MALCILIGCMAIFYGATFPMYGACAGDFFPKDIMGTVIGAWTPLYGCGAILTHWSTGMLRDVNRHLQLCLYRLCRNGGPIYRFNQFSTKKWVSADYFL